MAQVRLSISPAWGTLRTDIATIHAGGLASGAGLKVEKCQICKLSSFLVVYESSQLGIACHCRKLCMKGGLVLISYGLR